MPATNHNGKFCVIIPTFNHGPTLRYAIKSIQEQSYQNFEIYVIGDGAPDITRKIMADLCKADERIHYIDQPKGPRNGEIYRDPIIRKSDAEFIAYLSDDDIWFPNHLDVLAHFLQKSNFAHTLHINVFPNSEVMTQVVFLDLAEDVKEMLENDDYGFDLTFGAHRRDFYLKLPYGWRTTPQGINTDTYFWRQLLKHPDCRPVSIPIPTGIHYSNVDRRDWSHRQRTNELEEWATKLADPVKREPFFRGLTTAVANTFHHYRMIDVKEIARLQAKLQTQQEKLAELESIKSSRWWRIRNFLRRKF